MPRPLRLSAQAAAVALVAALVAVFVWKLAHDGSAATKGPAPRFNLPRLDGGGEVGLASLRGKAVVLNFWASWCIPCKKEAPQLERAWQRWRSRGLVVVGVDAQDFKGDARRFKERYGITYPLLRDGPGKVVGDYGVTGFPETFFVDRRGHIVGEHVAGAISRDRLERNIRVALRS
jgi:cytochrome c biogenesis protein CcmG/thiol:disulfide interchange protein DsbE